MLDADGIFWPVTTEHAADNEIDIGAVPQGKSRSEVAFESSDPGGSGSPEVERQKGRQGIRRRLSSHGRSGLSARTFHWLNTLVRGLNQRPRPSSRRRTGGSQDAVVTALQPQYGITIPGFKYEILGEAGDGFSV